MVSLAGSLAGLIPNNHEQYLQKLQQQQQQQHHDELDESFMTTINGRQQRRNRSGVTLGQEQKFLLIEHIRERPQIWDANNDGFRSNQSRQAAFNEVAQLLSNEEEQFTRIQIQEEWGKLRYCFTRIVKKLLEEAGGGQISEEQLATVTWAFFRPMAFLLEAVLQQLQSQPGCEKCESHGAEDGHGGGGGEAEHQQENVAKSDGSPHQMKPPKMRLRRRRRANVSRKNSGNSSGADFLKLEEQHLGEEEQHQQQQPSNVHSTNELLMSQVLGLANAQAQEQLLMANIQSAMQSSQQFLQQLKKQEGEESAAAVQGNTARMAVAQQQRQQEQTAAKTTLQQQQQQREERMFRRKRKGSNLDFLLDSALARPGEVGHSPLGQSTPAKSSQLLLGANAGEFTSPAQTIADSIANSSPQQQQQNGEEVIVLEERAAGGDREGSASGSAGGGGGAGALEEDINESFGRYIVQQLKSVSKKNELFSVQLRKELVDVCYKYEVKACTEGN